jgi:hypothetical protein
MTSEIDWVVAAFIQGESDDRLLIASVPLAQRRGLAEDGWGEDEGDAIPPFHSIKLRLGTKLCIALELRTMKAGIQPVSGQQLGVGALLYQPTPIHHQDQVGR